MQSSSETTTLFLFLSKLRIRGVVFVSFITLDQVRLHWVQCNTVGLGQSAAVRNRENTPLFFSIYFQDMGGVSVDGSHFEGKHHS